jgi:phenylacetic acid degradation operon negative regulatory protein
VDREAELALAIKDEPAADAISFVAGLGDMGTPETVAAEAWDLDAVREHYEAFIDDFSDTQASTADASFRLQTLLVHAWRKFPFVDPDLPDDLLPAGWPRQRAHTLFVARHAQWQAAARAHFEELEAGREVQAA